MRQLAQTTNDGLADTSEVTMVESNEAMSVEVCLDNRNGNNTEGTTPWRCLKQRTTATGDCDMRTQS